MFSTKTIAIAAATVAIATVGIQSANAAPRHDGIQYYGTEVSNVNFRISNQERRIRRARRAGRLNWVEARRARFELSHIRGFLASYLADDRLSFRERRHLNRLLDENGQRIRTFATNGWGGWNGWRPWRRDRDQRPTLSQYNGFQ